eukprot:scaffold339106_cov35-Prasinocladus_malaysianus.AAC.2
METQAKLDIHSKGLGAVEKSVAAVTQKLQTAMTQFKEGGGSGFSGSQRPSHASIPIPVPPPEGQQLDHGRAEEYVE